jgi:hypothetical protein
VGSNRRFIVYIKRARFKIDLAFLAGVFAADPIQFWFQNFTPKMMKIIKSNAETDSSNYLCQLSPVLMSGLMALKILKGISVKVTWHNQT